MFGIAKPSRVFCNDMLGLCVCVCVCVCRIRLENIQAHLDAPLQFKVYEHLHVYTGQIHLSLIFA